MSLFNELNAANQNDYQEDHDDIDNYFILKDAEVSLSENEDLTFFDDSSDISLERHVERHGLGYLKDMSEAFEEEATNASMSNAHDKKSLSELHKEWDEKLRKEEDEDNEKKENRTEALIEMKKELIGAGKKLLTLAKDIGVESGKSIREIFRLSYNLATGKNVKKEDLMLPIELEEENNYNSH